jgi:protein-disulfide isomerase
VPFDVLGVKAEEPAWGPADARVTIVEYSDFQCPYCKIFNDNTYGRLRQQYGNQVRFVFRDFPLDSIHPQARPAAEAAQCAHEQGKFWEYHDIIFANQQALQPSDLKRYARQLDLDGAQFDDCVDTRKYQASVEADLQDGFRRSVTGTPTFFINGQVLVGAQPFEEFEARIASILQAGD